MMMWVVSIWLIALFGLIDCFRDPKCRKIIPIYRLIEMTRALKESSITSIISLAKYCFQYF